MFLCLFTYGFVQVKEFRKYDTDTEGKWFKTYEDKDSVTKQPFSVDVGFG